MRKLLQFLSIFVLAGVMAACSSISSLSDGGRPDRTVVTPHSPTGLLNLQLARQYAAEGRFELAREHYLLALAASNDHNRDSIAQELHATDMMIKTLR